MASKTQYGRIAQLSFTSTVWTTTYADTVLLKGEIGVETDTRKIKIGDGTTTWSNLAYANPDYTLPIATSEVLGGIKSSTGVGAVTVNGTSGVASVGEVAKAQKLSAAATIGISGDVAGSASFDGSTGITIAVTGANASTSAHGFMSADDKVKLNGISTGANKVEASTSNGNIKIDGSETTVYTLPVAAADTLGGIKSGDILSIGSAGAPTFSDVVASTSGTGGTHGLMTAADKEKLNGVAAGAQVNVLEGLQIKYSRDEDFSDVTIDGNKKSQLDFSNYPTFDDLASALNFQGEKTGDQLKALTAANVKNGDVYTCSADDTGATVTFHAGLEYAAVIKKVGGVDTLSWTELGKWVDLSGYVLRTQKVNNKALSGDITLNGADIALTGYAKATAGAAVAATDTVDEGIGKLEYKIDVLNGSDSVSGSVAKSIKDAVGALDYAGATAGYYVTQVTEADGVIEVTREAKGSVASSNTGLVDGGTVYTAIDGAVKVDTITVNGSTKSLTGKTLPFAEGSTNGTIKVAGTDVAVHGLGSNAFTSTAFVPETRTINGETLNADVTLDGADLALTGYSKATAGSAVAATDTVNAAIGKLEFKIDNATTGTVESVGLAMPTGVFAVTGSPVTSTGTLTASLISQTANTVFAAPNGTAGAPTFRTLVADDIPTVQSSKVQLSGATANNIPKLDANGSYVDSGVAVSDLIDVSEDITLFQCTLSSSVPTV